MSLNKKILKKMVECLLIIIAVIIIKIIFIKLIAGVVQLIYGTIVLVWISDITGRVIEKNCRRYLQLMAVMMLLYFLLQASKYIFFIESETIDRHLWYAYYIPMILIPMYSCFVAVVVGSSSEADGAVLGKWRFLYIPSILLCALVMTNDLHWKVFAFEKNYEKWAESGHYTYEISYFIVLIYIVALFVAGMTILLRKCFFEIKIRHIWVLFLPAMFMMFYTVVNAFGLVPKYHGFTVLNLPEIYVMTIIMTWEMCIQLKLIRVNDEFEEIFKKSGLSAFIVDERGDIIYKAGNALEIGGDTEQLKSRGILDEHTAISHRDIRGGEVFWTYNIGVLNSLNTKLQEIRENLLEEGAILNMENKLKKEASEVAAYNALYDNIVDIVKMQLDRLREILSRDAGTEEQRRKDMAEACIVTAYIKRRSNLEIISGGNVMTGEGLKSEELIFSLRESLDFLRLYGIDADMETELTENENSERIISIYENFERTIEENLEKIEKVRLFLTSGGCVMRYRLSGDGQDGALIREVEL